MPPDHIEDLFDELDCTDPSDIGAFFRKINSKEAGWLARFLRGKSERDREMAGEEIQAEVNVSLTLLLFKFDSTNNGCKGKMPATRCAQLPRRRRPGRGAQQEGGRAAGGADDLGCPEPGGVGRRRAGGKSRSGSAVYSDELESDAKERVDEG